MRERAWPLHWPLLMSAMLTCVPVSADTVNARFPRQARDQANVFTRMFADLPPFAAQSDRCATRRSCSARRAACSTRTTT